MYMINTLVYNDNYFYSTIYEEIVGGLRLIACRAKTTDKEGYFNILFRYLNCKCEAIDGEDINSIALSHHVSYHSIYEIINRARFKLALYINSSKYCSYTINITHIYKTKKSLYAGHYIILS